MLQDEKRTSTYRNAILGNKHLFRGKVVMDVGCGTGILSMFAAQAGAAKIIGIDNSAIIERARKIIKDNNFEDDITLIRGKVEEVSLPEGIENVDIIVSEWMGQALFYESVLSTIIYARDKWLKPGGLIFPDRVALYLAGIEGEEELELSMNCWKDYYGLNMEAMRQWRLFEASIESIIPTRVVTNSCLVKNVDIYRIKEEDLSFTSQIHLQSRTDSLIHGFVLFFEVEFTSCVMRTGFSTSPLAYYTHWNHLTIYFDGKTLNTKKGEELFGSIRINPNSIVRVNIYLYIIQ
ncbi:hypothetical protein FSP39_016790 [Pinctada imbricata]|uniref:type I protein arginine methyltransferase n=1 Tax=Pinctada imbricata TaxID=66713 RepID=A0AA88YDJ1_PINIB|nr:hypothetical protein FSP39_016790 [Pinctada imbricata]